jgi:hypothetical protein
MEKIELSIDELNEVAGGMIKIGTGTGPFIPTTTGPTFPVPGLPPFGPFFPTGPIVIKF